MPTLTWVGKEKVVNHHHEVPFRVLKKQYTFHSTAQHNTTQHNTTQSYCDSQQKYISNRIIHGDNLEALKSLLPEFEGKINCIYIDPPYNTGKEEWIYNDNVNDPKIKKWLGQVVGKEGDDLSRHDKWLCMMYPRLKLLHRLLAKNGVIFISIDDDEVHSLRLILDEIFGMSSRLATFTWKTDGNFDNAAKIKNCHEYVLMYSKQPSSFGHPPVVDPNTPLDSKLFRPEIRNTIVKNGLKNPPSSFILPAGFPADFHDGVIDARTNAWPHYSEKCVVKNGVTVNSVEIYSGWSSLDLLNKFVKAGFNPVKDAKNQETVFKIISSGAIEAIKVRNTPSHVITALSGFGSTQGASSELLKMGITFSYPKPVGLISYLLSMVGNEDDDELIVLDSFAGTGTTAHAVLDLNSKSPIKRKFILIETLNEAETITAERVRRVINGYGQGDKAVAGLGGSFDYYTVGDPIFLPNNNLNEAVGIEVIRDYVAYTERIPETDRANQNNPYTPHLLGMNKDVVWLFNYEVDKATVLDMDYLASLKFGDKKPKNAIIYADRCLLEKSFMTKHGIIFKKIPRDITRF